ncbi:radical SAM protein [Pseudomonas chlororaphis]|uniref:radical SAM protein n=1 Tax=Pseudomonas chlororaphis TaxID=587753 RepID=UPI0039E198FA
MYKPSSYNIITPPLSSGNFVLFNTRTGRALEISEDRRVQYEQFSSGKLLHGELVAFLAATEFALRDDVDEALLIKAKYHKAIDAVRKLSITVGLTESCNFRCSYCYQGHETRQYDDAIVKSFKEVLEKLSDDGYNSLHVNWFGGEPLLRLDLLSKLSEMAREICQASDKSFTQFITTNGSLLTAEKFFALDKLGVSQYQITLDGPKEFHDGTRPRKGGKSSYQSVLDGCKSVIDGGCQLIVRMNLSRPIGDSIEDWLDDLVAVGCSRNNTAIHIVRAIDHESALVNDFYYSNEEFAHIWVKCLAKVKSRGFSIPHVLPLPYNCSFDSGKTVYINHEGEYGSCSSIPSKKQNNNVVVDFVPIRFVMSPYEVDHGVQKRSDSFFESNCKKCKFLPSCVGGCQYLEISGQEKCTPERYVFHELISLNYDK